VGEEEGEGKNERTEWEKRNGMKGRGSKPKGGMPE
jgi:hypothetical protein